MQIRNTTVAFFGGVIAHAALVSLFADCMGRLRYADHVKDNWIPEWLSIPLALLMFAVGVQLLRKSEETPDA